MRSRGKSEDTGTEERVKVLTQLPEVVQCVLEMSSEQWGVADNRSMSQSWCFLATFVQWDNLTLFYMTKAVEEPGNEAS